MQRNLKVAANALWHIIRFRFRCRFLHGSHPRVRFSKFRLFLDSGCCPLRKRSNILRKPLFYDAAQQHSSRVAAGLAKANDMCFFR